MAMDIESDFWSDISKEELPIVLYGTGNGADRLLYELGKRGVKVRGCFASDGFVRSRSFHEFKVLSYEDARHLWGDMAIVIGFGTHDRNVIDNIKRIKKENKVYLPDTLADEEGSLFDLEYFDKHRKNIEFAYSLLEDAFSKKCLESSMKYRLTADIDYLLDIQEDERESWKLLDLNDDEIYMDIGAYRGDTIERFLSLVTDYDRIYGFEPDRKTFKKLTENTRDVGNIELFNAFVADKEGTVLFSSGKGRGSSLGDGDRVEAVTIDSALNGDRATLLKFDTEGFEREAIRGAENTIKRYKPKMVLSAYHRIDDIWELPKQVLALNDGYRFYLRKAPCIPLWDLEYFIKDASSNIN